MIRPSPLRTVAVFSFLLTILFVPSAQLSASESSPAPASWPRSEQLAPAMTAWPNLIRIWGPDRYQTNLATALALRGEGGYPFDSPDSMGGNLSLSLSDNSHWWGASSCARSVIITAGDSPADSLSAASLSNPVGFSIGPYLRRVASADPLFDPIGGYQYVNTHMAPVLVTRSARLGVSTLSLSTRVAIKDLRSGGCRLARDAVIVGGPDAVPVQIEQELLALGIRQVFRVGGENRYETAAATAQALGTQKKPDSLPHCRDRYASDGQIESHFYAASVVEWRKSSSECDLLGRTVVLVDGVAGADALAAAWWIGFWQVPVLLHNGSQRLPEATSLALQSLDISNVIVVGGVARISDAVAAKAAALSNSRLLRVAGQDRYGTSVEMARQFGGWWGTGVGVERQASIICFAASSGGSTKLTGWPDALGAGPWCGGAAAQAASVRAPSRSTYPYNGPFAKIMTPPANRPQSMVPIILLPAGARTIPTAVKQFLLDSYPPSARWCSSNNSPSGCLQPGFGVVFGGVSVISDDLLSHLSALLGGNVAELHKRSRPELVHPFVTELEMTPIYFQTGSGNFRFCTPRGGYEGARWLVVRSDEQNPVKAYGDVINEGWYKTEPGGLPSIDSSGSPGCVRFRDDGAPSALLGLVGPEGWKTETQNVSIKPANSIKLSAPITTSGPVSVAGASLAVTDTVGGATEALFWTSVTEVEARIGAVEQAMQSSELKFALQRTEVPGRATFRAEWALNTSDERLSGLAAGEALLVDGVWLARGRAELNNEGLFSGADGGFVANVPAKSASAAGFSATWQLDLHSPDT